MPNLTFRIAHLQIYLGLWGLLALGGLGSVPAPTGAAGTPTTPASDPSAAAPATTSGLSDTEISVLQQVLAHLSCFGQAPIYTDQTTYSLNCAVAAGHATDVSITRYATPAEAYTAFVTMHGEPLEKFGCYPANAWMDYEDPPHETFRHRYHVWVAENWLIRVHSFDDTYYSIAYEPRAVSQLVMQAGQRQLFAACYTLYVPATFTP